MIVHGEELLVPAHLNFAKFILDRLRKANPDDTCLINCTSGQKLSYGEFTQHAVNVSAALAALGVARGDTVALAGEPGIAFMPTALAVIFTGAAFTPIELDCGRAVLVHKLNLTMPKYIICSGLFWKAYSDVLNGLNFIKTFICFDDIDEIQLTISTMALRHLDVTKFEPAAVQGGTDVAVVVYSAGTTGLSKGVMLTHLNCIAGVAIFRYTQSESLQTCLLGAELSSMYVITTIFYFLCMGKRVVYTESIPELNTLHDYQVNIMFVVPAIVKYMINAEIADDSDLLSLKTVYSTGDHLHPTIRESFKQRFPHVRVLSMFSGTEFGPITAQKPSDIETASSATHTGLAAPGVTFKVVDVQTRATLGPNQRGEICVRSARLMKGYLGVASPYLDDQGFFLTGDLGYFDNYKQLYLVNRLKDVICYVGFQVGPMDIETVLLAHPAVREAVVVGKPAYYQGELPAAFVVLQPGAQATETELVDYVAKEVTGFMQLRGGVRFISEIPRSSRRKILRRRLREMLELEEPCETLK